ncbi:MAG: hypothetical protein HXY48_03995 [Ignavibacteriaceae bacterium]|nr:hypothetical protein [Ignavibacteriaceae bacterium]
MKRIIILAIVLFTAVTFNADAKRHHHGVGGYFYTQLSPYGTWIEVDYGVVVWRPTIIRVNWLPYQMGRWVWTYDGWYWDSYEPFGFITYHYGRWYYDDYYGWLWYPDYEWAPAWVEWRYDNNYIGWAPLHPYAVFSVSVGIYFTNTYYTPYTYWNFVNYNYFCDPYVYNYYAEPGYKYRIYNGTKYRNNYSYHNGRVQNRGVDVKYVSDRSGKEIRQRDIIRVRDAKEFTRDDYGKRDEIRTLDLKRDELVKNDLGRMEVKRENRKTSLDLDKVQIGRRENTTGEKKRDKSFDRNIEVSSKDQSRYNVKTGVDKIFEQNRSKTKSYSDINVSRNNETIEKRKSETGKVSNQNENVRKNNNINTRSENNVKDQSWINSNDTAELNKKRQEQNTQVKRENTRVSNNDQVRKNEVKEQSRNENQQRRTSETKLNTDRSIQKDNSKEKTRR